MAEPSLIELAAVHAKRRWTKKRRNADLRRCGYNPDGPDGKLYRAHFERMCRMADVIAGMSKETDITYLWDVPDEEWRAWIASGCGDMSLSEYRERLAIVCRQIESADGVVTMVPATVADVLRVISELGMNNDPQGRAAAVGIIGIKGEK
jgi:hypothetical protein